MPPGWQHEAYPYNDPRFDAGASRCGHRMAAGSHVSLDLPGRTVSSTRLAGASVGRVALYLLDATTTLNSPADRGITGQLYDAGSADAPDAGDRRSASPAGDRSRPSPPEVEICHMNEGHAAFAVLERARAYMRPHGDHSFWEAFVGDTRRQRFHHPYTRRCRLRPLPARTARNTLRYLDFLDEARH